MDKEVSPGNYKKSGGSQFDFWNYLSCQLSPYKSKLGAD